MKRFIAIWVVCALLFCGFGAGAEDQTAAAKARESEGWRLSNDMSVDPVLLHELLIHICPSGLLRRQVEKAGVLLNAIEPTLTIAGDGLQLDVDINGNNALSIGGTRTEDGVAIASSLFPSYVVTVYTGKLAEIVSNIKPMAGRPKFRAKDGPAGAAPPEAAAPAGEGEGGETAPSETAESDSETLPVDEMAEYVSITEPEPGEYQANGVNYDVMRTYSVDCSGLVGLWNTFVDWVFRNKGIASLLAVAKKADLEISDAQVKALLPAEALPRLTVTSYSSSATANRYITATAASEDGKTVYGNAQLQITADDVTAEAHIPRLPLDVDFKLHHRGGFRAELDVRGEEPLLYASFHTVGSSKGRLEINATGSYLGANFEVAPFDASGEGLRLTADLYYTDEKTPLFREELTFQPQGALTLDFTDGKKTVVPITSLVNVNSGYLPGFILDIAFNGIGRLLDGTTEVMSGLKQAHAEPADAARPAPGGKA